MALKGDASDLDTLAFGGKPLVPLVSGFSKHRRSGVIQSSVPGGMTRQRLKYYNNPHVAEATFYLETGAQQDFIQMFFNRNEGKKFICHLAADNSTVEPYVVQVIGDWKLPYNSSQDAQLSVTLEIVPSRSFCYDEFIYDMGQCLGDELGCMMQELEYLVRRF